MQQRTEWTLEAVRPRTIVCEIQLPQKPGLGIELNREALARYSVD